MAIRCWGLHDLIIVNVRTRQEVRRIRCGKFYSLTVLGADRDYLAIAHENIIIWSVESGQVVKILGVEAGQNHLSMASKTIWSLLEIKGKNGSGVDFLASGHWNGEIKIWNWQRGQLLHSFKAHEKTVNSMLMLNGGGSGGDGGSTTMLLASASWWSKKIKIWKLMIKE